MESFDDDSNRMHSSSHGSSATGSANTVPHIIVACPSCTTKFAVESSVVAAVEDPRFHCSRCDQVFSLEEVRSVMHRDLSSHGEETAEGSHLNAEAASRQVVDSSRQSAAQDFIAVQNKDSFPQPTPSLANRQSSPDASLGTHTSSIPSPIRASDFTVAANAQNDSQEPHSADPDYRFNSGSNGTGYGGEAVGFQPSTASSGSTSSDAPKVFTSSITLHSENPQNEPVAEEPPAISQPTTRPTISTSTSSKSSGWVVVPEDITTPSPRADLTSTTLAHASSSALSSPLPSSREQIAPKSAPKSKLSGANPPPPRGRGTQQELRFDVPDYPTTLSRMQSLALISAPLFIALAALFIGSYSIRLSPDTLGAGVSALTSWFGGESPSLPPAELTVTKVSLKMVKIPSKEVVPVVTGVLSNRSQSKIGGVTLEAVGFDAKGGLLLSAQAPLKSALSKEKVNELPLETIRKFQRSLSARSADIKPGEDVPFSIALIPELNNHS